MFVRIRIRLARIGFVKKLLENPTDLEIFKLKPSPRFLVGLSLIGFSYLIAWPLITALGVVAVHLKNPLIFVVGSPVSYGISHLVFLLGVFVAGKNTVVYMNTFLKWSLGRFLRKVLGQEAIARAGLRMEE